MAVEHGGRCHRILAERFAGQEIRQHVRHHQQPVRLLQRRVTAQKALIELEHRVAVNHLDAGPVKQLMQADFPAACINDAAIRVTHTTAVSDQLSVSVQKTVIRAPCVHADTLEAIASAGNSRLHRTEQLMV